MAFEKFSLYLNKHRLRYSYLFASSFGWFIFFITVVTGLIKDLVFGILPHPFFILELLYIFAHKFFLILFLIYPILLIIENFSNLQIDKNLEYKLYNSKKLKFFIDTGVVLFFIPIFYILYTICFYLIYFVFIYDDYGNNIFNSVFLIALPFIIGIFILLFFEWYRKQHKKSIEFDFEKNLKTKHKILNFLLTFLKCFFISIPIFVLLILSLPILPIVLVIILIIVFIVFLLKK